MKSIFLISAIFLFSCKVNKGHLSSNKSDRYVSLVDYEGETSVEKIAAKKVKNYLQSVGLVVDKFFVCGIDYPDAIDSAHENSFTIVFDLAHRKTIDYMDSIEIVNSSLLEKHRNEDFIPVAIPATGNISGLDRHIYYYSEKDLVVNILSQ
ncbi:MAG: hypothetical protein WA958_19220 [Tunicatimonas sp.]